MSNKDAFFNTLNKIDFKIKHIYDQIETTMQLNDMGRLEEAYRSALKLEETTEELVLLTRSLPVYTGHPDAERDVRSVIKKVVPIEIGFTKLGWFCVKLPLLLPKKERGSGNYIRSILYPAFKDFFKNKASVRYEKCVLIYRHVYDKNRPERRKRDHDNIEINMVSDIVAMYVMPDDGPSVCSHYYLSVEGSSERTEVYVVPEDEFSIWLAIENTLSDEGLELFERP